MAKDNEYAYDLQPADDIDSGDLDIVVRSLNFGKSAKYSPCLIIISAEESVCFRVLYGWDNDDFDDTFSTELIGRTCRISGIEPKHLTNFSAWLRNTSGASADSTAMRLPQPICRSAQEMWESLCELKRQFATDAFCLPKEIRRRVEAWEVVNWHLDEFFMDTEPSEEDKVSVFGSVGPASEGPADLQSAGTPSSSNELPTSSTSTPSIAAPAPSSTSSLNAEAATFVPSLSPATVPNNSEAVSTPHLSCRQRKMARDEVFRARIAKKIQDRREKREMRMASSSTSSASSSSSFKKPHPPAQKSIVVVPRLSSAPARPTTSSASSARKRERSEGLPVLQRPIYVYLRRAAEVAENDDNYDEEIENGTSIFADLSWPRMDRCVFCWSSELFFLLFGLRRRRRR